MARQSETPEPGKVVLAFFALLFVLLIIAIVGFSVEVWLWLHVTDDLPRKAETIGAALGVMPLIAPWGWLMRWHTAGMS